jgi:hypothetical protein
MQQTQLIDPEHSTPNPINSVGLNISGGGICFEAHAPVDPGAMVALSIYFTAFHRPILALARVAWCTQHDDTSTIGANSLGWAGVILPPKRLLPTTSQVRCRIRLRRKVRRRAVGPVEQAVGHAVRRRHQLGRSLHVAAVQQRITVTVDGDGPTHVAATRQKPARMGDLFDRGSNDT